MMNKQQLKMLRSKAHDCKPVIWVGQQGLTENVTNEINTALDHHELIKIRLRVGDREKREQACNDICAKTRAELIRKIGNTLTIYRRNNEAPVIVFKNT